MIAGDRIYDCNQSTLDEKPGQNLTAPMTDSRAMTGPTSRRLVCAECGTEFGCDLSGNCWCMTEPVTLPMPTSGSDCLCRACLQKAAAGLEAGSAS
jgi:hypothetical protein